MAQGEQCGSLEPCTYVDGCSVRSHIIQKQLVLPILKAISMTLIHTPFRIIPYFSPNFPNFKIHFLFFSANFCFIKTKYS